MKKRIHIRHDFLNYMHTNEKGSFFGFYDSQEHHLQHQKFISGGTLLFNSKIKLPGPKIHRCIESTLWGTIDTLSNIGWYIFMGWIGWTQHKVGWCHPTIFFQKNQINGRKAWWLFLEIVLFSKCRSTHQKGLNVSWLISRATFFEDPVNSSWKSPSNMTPKIIHKWIIQFSVCWILH